MNFDDKSSIPIDDVKSTPNLLGRTIKGGVWVFVSKITQQLVALVRLIVLARLLDPAEFGLLGIALLSMSLVNKFTITGFDAALIQKKEDTESYLDAAWTVGVIRAFVLLVILYFAAPYVANFFGRYEASDIIRVLSLTVLLKAFGNIGTIYFRKNLKFNKDFIYQMSGTLVDVTVAVILACKYKTVWALVFGKLAGEFVRCILSYVLHPYRPDFNIEMDKVRSLWPFGKHILGTSILNFFTLEGDDIFLGKMLGAEILGFYRYAYRISNMVATHIGDLMGTVLFSAYSKIQDDKERLADSYLKSNQLSVLITLPIAGGLLILAPEFTRIVFGEKWMPMVPAMRILSLFGAMKTMQSGGLYKAIGRPDIVTKFSFVRLIIMAAIIYPLTIRFGMAGTAFSVFLPSLITKPFNIFVSQKMIGFKTRDLAEVLVPSIIATILMMLSIHIAKSFVGEMQLTLLVLMVLLGGISYFVCIAVLSLACKRYQPVKLVKNMLEGLR